MKTQYDILKAQLESLPLQKDRKFSVEVSDLKTKKTIRLFATQHWQCANCKGAKKFKDGYKYIAVGELFKKETKYYNCYRCKGKGGTSHKSSILTATFDPKGTITGIK